MSFDEIYIKIKDEYKNGDFINKRENLKERITSNPVILYGLGFFGGVIVKNFKLHGIEVECFCDRQKRGIDKETGLKIISPDELKERYSNANIVISVANPSNEKSVRIALEQLGFCEEQVFGFADAYKFIRKSRVEQVSLPLDEFEKHIDGYKWAYDFFSDEESKKVIISIIRNYLFNETFEYEPPEESYFPTQLKLNDNEIFIDAGLYTGDTTEEFIRRVNGQYRKIIGFDIDKNNLASAYKNLEGEKNVEIIEKGLWDKSAFLQAELGIMAGSNIKEGAGDTVELISLDEMFGDSYDDYPTFIKMDIEGSEKPALVGAQKIIETAHPKLAICAYHKPEDIYVLPQLINKINPNYKMFLKHYSPYVWDTVLYAIQEEN